MIKILLIAALGFAFQPVVGADQGPILETVKGALTEGSKVVVCTPQGSGIKASEARIFADSLRAGLDATGRVSTVGSSGRIDADTMQRDSSLDCGQLGCAIRVGRSSTADFVVIGDMEGSGNHRSLTLWVVDPIRGRTVQVVSQDLEGEDWVSGAVQAFVPRLTGGYSARMELPDRVGEASVRVPPPGASTSIGEGNTDIHELMVDYGRTMQSAQLLSVVGGGLLVIGVPMLVFQIRQSIGQAEGCALGGFDEGTNEPGCNDGFVDPIPAILVIAGGGYGVTGLLQFVRGWYLHHKIDRLQKARGLVGFSLTPWVVPHANTFGAVARLTF